jgi:triacylglycerol lipase
VRLRSSLVAVAACSLALPAGAAAQGEEPLPPQGQSPPGTNNFDCRPPARHPYPVVLVHGTFLNMRDSWTAVAPALTRLGYCVFALDYGNNGTGDIPTSARQLSTFVNRVLSATGASRVSVVGHSQGGMMPRYLIKNLGGTDKVDDLVGFSPSNHGTTNPAAGPSAGFGCTACAQQVRDSEFIRELNAGDETPGSASYTVVQTRNDEVVTPYDSAFLAAGPAVTNVLLQDRCATNQVDHLGIPYDPVAIQWMLNAVGRPGPADPGFQPDCSGQGVSTFPDSDSAPPGTNSGSGQAARLPRIVYGSRSGLRGKRLRVALASRGGTVRRLRLSLRRGNRVVGRSRAATITRKRKVVVVKLRRPLKPGRYRLVALGRDAAGRLVTTEGPLRVR